MIDRATVHPVSARLIPRLRLPCVSERHDRPARRQGPRSRWLEKEQRARIHTTPVLALVSQPVTGTTFDECAPVTRAGPFRAVGILACLERIIVFASSRNEMSAVLRMFEPDRICIGFLDSSPQAAAAPAGFDIFSTPGPRRTEPYLPNGGYLPTGFRECGSARAYGRRPAGGQCHRLHG